MRLLDESGRETGYFQQVVFVVPVTAFALSYPAPAEVGTYRVVFRTTSREGCSDVTGVVRRIVVQP